MRVPFIKMHGLGNDFIVLDARAQSIPNLSNGMVSRLSDRKTGIGCDQFIVLQPSDVADFRMVIYNQDGGEVEACGNATRAVALLHGQAARIETAAGLLQARPQDGGIAVDMGVPRFDWQDIPLAYAMDTLTMPVAWDELEAPSAVNVGNPHVVFFVEDVDAVDLERLGPVIEHDPLFPARVNVNVASVFDRETIALRVWERGVGETRACGTGACATAFAAMRRGLTGRSAEVRLAGGTLAIEWNLDNRVIMTGPAVESYRGTFDWGDYA